MSWEHALLALVMCSQAANGQLRVFMAEDGTEHAAPITGNTTIYMEPGSTQLVHIWCEFTGLDQRLYSYQAIIRWFAVPQGDATGTVSYVDDGLHPNGSGFVNASRSDFVFHELSLSWTAIESQAQDGFGPVAGLNHLSGVGIDVEGLYYLGEFMLESTLDACGQHQLDYVPMGQAPYGGIVLTEHGTFPPRTIDELQPLTIDFGPRPAFCGDSVINSNEMEECDDGNTVNGDGCSSACRIEYCGDGVVNNFTESCDDGNTNDGDGCTSDCIVVAPIPAVSTHGLAILAVVLMLCAGWTRRRA
jgi:cysteine-rich repeat protein